MAFKAGDLVRHEDGTDMLVVEVFPTRTQGSISLDGKRTVEHFTDVECTWTQDGKSHYQKFDARKLKLR